MVAFLSILSSCSVLNTKEVTNATAYNQPPSWAKNAIWYQIFVERFRNGDNQNNPNPEHMKGAWPHNYSSDWKITPWNSDWYEGCDQAENLKEYYDNNIQSRRYGGDLQGVLDKLDYLKNLGITAIYFNPLNDAPSLHKYDARNFHHIDINFGPDPEGDLALINSENPLDPSTWKWTRADKLFLKVIKECHKRNIRVVLDYSWNHTGIEFWAWKDILKKGKDSNYVHWYQIDSFDDPNSPNGIKYTGWAGVSELPELKKIEVENRVNGHPYKGNILPEIKKHIFDVSSRWLDPNADGKFDDGVDGYRLDVADQIGLDFWREYRQFCRSINPECYLVGEIWWEKWPDNLMDPRPYLQGDIFDAVMFYQAYKPARDFFAKTENYQGAEKFKEQLDEVYKNIPDYTQQAMMLLNSSHDTERLLTSFFNKNKYKFNIKPSDNVEILTGKPDSLTYTEVKNYLIFQYTSVGSPHIWNGDEMGMWGTDDPDTRKPLWWDDINFEPETNNPFKPNSEHEKIPVGFNKEWHDYYAKLISIRKNNSVLAFGAFNWIFTQGDVLVYERFNQKNKITVYINNSNQTVKIPNLKTKGMDLLTGKNITYISELKPWQAYIIKNK